LSGPITAPEVEELVQLEALEPHAGGPVAQHTALLDAPNKEQGCFVQDTPALRHHAGIATRGENLGRGLLDQVEDRKHRHVQRDHHGADDAAEHRNHDRLDQ
jgi:hypothetical protein